MKTGTDKEEFKNNKINIYQENEKNIKGKEDFIHIEISDGEVIKEEIKTLKKYPNLLLSACINVKICI